MERLPKINPKPLNLSSKKEVPVYLTQQGLLEYPTTNMRNTTDVNNNSLIENNPTKTREKDAIPDQAVARNRDIANANMAAKARSFACVSCSFVSSSVEALGAHFVDQHFLDSETIDDNNNNVQAKTKESNNNIQDASVPDYDHKKFRNYALYADNNNNKCETATRSGKNFDDNRKIDSAEYRANYEYSSKWKKDMKTLDQTSKIGRMMIKEEGSFMSETGCLDLSIKSDKYNKPDAQNQKPDNQMGSCSQIRPKYEVCSERDRTKMADLGMKIARQAEGLAPNGALPGLDNDPTPYDVKSYDVESLSNQSRLSKKEKPEAKERSGNDGKLEQKDRNRNYDKDGEKQRNVEKGSDGFSRVATEVELLSCLVCARSYPLKSALMKHLNKIHQLNNLCQLCYFNEGIIMRFANPVSLRNHKMRAHPSDMVRCECGAMLCDEKLLLAHKKKFKCDLNGEGNNGHDMVRCICGKRFENNMQLDLHKTKCRKRYSLNDPYESMGLDYSQKKTKVETSTSTSTYSSINEDDCEKSEKYSKQDNDKLNSDCKTSLHNNQNIKDENNNLPNKEPFSNIFDFDNQDESKPKRSYRSIQTLSENKNLHSYNANSDSKTLDQVFTSTSKQNSSNHTSKTKAASSTKKTRKTGKKRVSKDGKYPCKVCRQRFKRPYLYVHQKTVHQPKRWVLVEPKKSGPVKRPFSCGWCSYQGKDMKAMVYHHYSKHQELELNVKSNL